jgi:hypothetical protein
MHPTVKRIAVLGALGTTLGMVAPVAGASTDGLPPVSTQVIVGPSVTGPVVITKAPSSFVNVNNQDSAGGNVAGVQVAAP